MTGTTTERPTPLEMARNCAHAVLDIADWQDRDPLGARVAHSGEHGKQSAELGACMALVSIAESLDKIARALYHQPRAEDGPRRG